MDITEASGAPFLRGDSLKLGFEWGGSLTLPGFPDRPAFPSLSAWTAFGDRGISCWNLVASGGFTDKFEETMAELAKLGDVERNAKIEELKGLCTCGDCPSYTDCAREKGELLYCATGKSPECIEEEVDCICASCPVTDAIGLTGNFYCMRGSEAQQRKAQ